MSSMGSFTIETVWIAGRVLALASAFFVLAWAFRHWRRAAERDTQRLFEQLDLVRADLMMMKEALQLTVQRVDTAAKQVAHDVRLAPAQAGTAARGYEIAARLARNGASKDELIKSCSLTAPEAELLVRLHAPRPAPPAAPASDSPVASAKAKASESVTFKSAEARGLERVSELGRMRQQAMNTAAANTAPAATQSPPARTAKQRSRLVAVG